MYANHLVKHLSCAAASLLLTLFPERATYAESLERLVEHAITSHPRVRVASSTARVIRYEIEQAEAVKNPRFSAISDPGYGYNARAREGRGAGDFGGRGSILVWDDGRSNLEIKRQEARHLSATDRALLASEQLGAQVADSYLEAHKQMQLERLNLDNVRAHEELFERVRQIAAIDRGRTSDLTQVRARLEQARANYASRQGSAQEAYAQLEDIAGMRAGTLVAPRDPADAIPSTYREALGMVQGHPAARAAEVDIQVAQRAAEVASKWWSPRVDLQGTLNSPDDIPGSRRYLHNYDVRFAVQWTPFDGGVGQAAAQAAAEQVNAARDSAASVRRDLSAEVTRAWSQAESRRTRINAYDALVEQTAAVRAGYWEQFTIGRRTMVDLLNAENEAFQARLTAETERFELLQVRYRLLATVAKLTRWLGISANPAAAGPKRATDTIDDSALNPSDFKRTATQVFSDPNASRREISVTELKP
jgi:outer membrane protein, adhesin transport system